MGSRPRPVGPSELIARKASHSPGPRPSHMGSAAGAGRRYSPHHGLTPLVAPDGAVAHIARTDSAASGDASSLPRHHVHARDSLFGGRRCTELAAGPDDRPRVWLASPLVHRPAVSRAWCARGSMPSTPRTSIPQTESPRLPPPGPLTSPPQRPRARAFEAVALSARRPLFRRTVRRRSIYRAPRTAALQERLTPRTDRPPGSNGTGTYARPGARLVVIAGVATLGRVKSGRMLAPPVDAVSPWCQRARD